MSEKILTAGCRATAVRAPQTRQPGIASVTANTDLHPMLQADADFGTGHHNPDTIGRMTAAPGSVEAP